jgi:uncharacterized membrane protein YkgB
MNTSFNIAENGAGSYHILAILRWVMVVIFVSFGMQKFTLQSAQGIVQFISNSPFVSWLSVFGLRGEAYFLGVAELGIAALLVAGAFSPVLSAIGSLMGMITFAITWSFFFTTPGVVVWSWSTDPMAWNLAGEFIYKGYRLAVCLHGVVPGIAAAIRGPVALRLERFRHAANVFAKFREFRKRHVSRPEDDIDRLNLAFVSNKVCAMTGRSGALPYRALARGAFRLPSRDDCGTK